MRCRSNGNVSILGVLSVGILLCLLAFLLELGLSLPLIALIDG